MKITSFFQSVAAALTCAVLSTRSADAQTLPTVNTPAAAGTGDFIGVLDALMQQGVTVLIFLVGAAAFVLVGWSVIAKFNECRAGRAEWSEAAVTAGIGAVILVFSTFLLTQANTIFAQV